MSGHKFNLPWSIKQVNGKDTATILDCEGIPVAHALYYTSLAAKQPDKGVCYNTTDAAGIIRARAIVDGINATVTADIS